MVSMAYVFDANAVLRMVANRLAVPFSEIAQQFPATPPGGLKPIMQQLEDRGLVRRREVPGSDDLIYMITADGASKAERTDWALLIPT